MTAIGILRMLPNDSFETLKGLLHRAFAPPGGMGLNCTCFDRRVETIRNRVEHKLLRAAESSVQETARPDPKPTPYPWPARHPAELALLAKSARSNCRCGGRRTRNAGVVVASPGAVGADLRRR